MLSCGHDMPCFHVVMLSCCNVWEDPGSVIRVLHDEGAVIYHVSREGHHYNGTVHCKTGGEQKNSLK